MANCRRRIINTLCLIKFQETSMHSIKHTNQVIYPHKKQQYARTSDKNGEVQLNPSASEFFSIQVFLTLVNSRLKNKRNFQTVYMYENINECPVVHRIQMCNQNYNFKVLFRSKFSKIIEH